MSQEKKLAVVLAEDLYEDLELHYPRLRLKEAGFDVLVAGPAKGATYKSKFGYWAKADVEFKEIDPAKVSVLVIPGGFAPDRLRRYADCLELVKKVDEHGGVIGAASKLFDPGHICHAAWVAISAKIVKGKKATCFMAVKDDLINAGALYDGEARVVVDGNQVSAQTPEDLPGFMAEILKIAKLLSEPSFLRFEIMDPRMEMLMRLAAMQQAAQGGGGGDRRGGGGGFFRGPQGQIFEDYAGSEEEDEEVDEDDEDIDLSDYLPKPLEEMTVDDLKAECKKRDLPATGSRKTLESRIMDDIEQEHMRKAFEAMGIRFGPGGDDEDEADEEYEGEEGEYDFPEGITLEELMGMPKAEEMEKEEWLKLWLEVDTNLREDSFHFTTFQRALNPRLMEVSMPQVDFASQIAAALGELQDSMSKILEHKKPVAIAASKLAGVTERLDAIKKLSTETPRFMRNVYFSNEYDDQFPNEKASEDWSADRMETFGVTVLAARCGSWKSTVSWRGQFLLRANPVTGALEFDMFRYTPSRIPPDVKLAALRLGSEANTATGRFIFEEMERFEVSRALQMRFPFESITRVGLIENVNVKSTEDAEQRREAVLIVEVSETPQFFTKRLNTQAAMMNDWRPRADFTTDSQASSSGRFCFLGQAAALRDFAALLLAQCPKAVVDNHAAEFASTTDALPYSAESLKRATAASEAATTSRQTTKASIDAQAQKDRSKTPAQELLNLLVSSGLLESDAAQSGDVQQPLATVFGPCFYDFITFQASEVTHLEKLFSSELTSGASGILDVDEFGGETVLHFLKYQKKHHGGKSSLNSYANHFYSFCQKQLLEKDEHAHCDQCRNCRDNTFWHCHSCNKCSAGEEGQRNCEHCGVKMGSTDAHFATANRELKPKPFPLSRRLDKSGPQFVAEDMEDDDLLVVSDDSDDDQPTFDPPAVEDDDDEGMMMMGDEEEDEEDEEDEEPEPVSKKAKAAGKKPQKKVSFFEDVEDIEFEDEDDDEEDDDEEDDGPFAARGGKPSKKPAAKKPAAKKAGGKGSASDQPTSSPFVFGQAPQAGPTGSAGFAKSAFGFDVPPPGFTFAPSGDAPAFNMGSFTPPQNTSRGGGKSSRGRGPRGRL